MSSVDAACLLDQLQRVVDDGQRGQAEEVHLQQADLLDGRHVVLRDDFVVVGPCTAGRGRSAAAARSRRRRRAPSVARQAFETLRDIHQLPRRADPLRRPRRSSAILLDAPFERDVERGRDHLGDPLDVGDTVMSSARPTSLIAARAPCVPKVMICATCSRPYFCGDVVDHLAAAVHAEVDVDIGHARCAPDSGSARRAGRTAADRYR